MSRLGKHGPLARLKGTVQGILHPPRKDGAPKRDTLVIAHRGAARVAPENTIEAFASAAEAGADAIETDICVTRDGCFVLWHDADPDGKIALARKTIVPGAESYGLVLADVGSEYRCRVCRLDLADFRRDYGYVRKDESGHETERLYPALLHDLFAWLPKEERIRHVYLDVKLQPDEIDAARRLLRLTAERARELPDRTLHFLTPQAEVAQALARDARSSPLPENVKLTPDFELPGVLPISAELGLRNVSMGCGDRLWPDFLKEVEDVVAARDAGEIATVVTWTMNDEDELRRLLALGPDGIMTDSPELLRRLLAS